MKSDGREISEGKLVKATDLLWKIWWFCFYLIIVPSLIAVIGFYIFNFIIRDIYISSGFAVISFMFSLLIFYKPFDKYRTNSFFRNKYNNPIARIHILYLVSILALIVTHNAVIVLNFIFHIIFLSYTFDTKYSWLFALISDIIFYFITYSSTREVRKRLLSKIQKSQPISSDLDEFKRRFSLSILSLVFILIIQMPFVVILVFTLSGQTFSNLEIFNAGLFSIALLIFYFKVRVYFSIYHQKKKQPQEVEIVE
ncbi:MAG: hypothetical protein P8Y23_01975 [Candidatus Lokiarchaeota archaeon]